MMFVQPSVTARAMATVRRLPLRLRPLLRREGKFIAAMCAAWLAPAVLYSVLSRPQYSATALVRVSPARMQSTNAAAVNRSDAIEGEREWAMSTPVLAAAANRPGVASLASLENAGPVTEFLTDNIRTTGDARTMSLSISIDLPRGADAAAVANAVAEEYARSRGQYQPAPAADHLSAQRSGVAADLAAKNEQRLQLLHGAGGAEFDSAIAGADAAIRQLRDALASAGIEQAAAQAGLQQASLSFPDDPDHQKLLAAAQNDARWTIATDADAARAREEMEAAQAQYETAATISPFSPQAVSLKDRIERMRAEFIVASRRRADAAESKRKSLQAQLDEQTGRLDELTTRAADLNRLDGEIHRLGSQLDTLDGAITAAIIGAQSDGATVTILSRAAAAATPSSPRRGLAIVGGLLVGLFSGLAGAHMRVAGRPRFASRQDVEGALGVPVLGSAPSGAEMTYLAPAREPSALSEALWSIVAETARAGNGPASMLIVSASPEDGRALLAAQLAADLARSGRRTLLIDADLRRPRMHDLFALAGGAGLADALLQLAIPDVCMVATDVAGLRLMPAGARALVPEAILNPLNLAPLLEEISGRFDAIVFHAPELDRPETAVLAACAGATVIALDPEMTDRAAAGQAVDQLRGDGATIAGIVLIGEEQIEPDRNG